MREMLSGATVPRLLTLREVARLLGLSVATVTDPRWRRAAGLRVTRIGRGRRIAGVTVEDYTAVLRRDGDEGEPA